MKNIKIILVILVSSIFYVSCESTTTQELEGVVLTPVYSKNIEPVMTAHCTSCHSDGGSQQPPYLDTYDAVKAACLTSVNGNGTVLCRIDASCGSIMPSNGDVLSKNTVSTIKRWATQGYAN